MNGDLSLRTAMAAFASKTTKSLSRRRHFRLSSGSQKVKLINSGIGQTKIFSSQQCDEIERKINEVVLQGELGLFKPRTVDKTPLRNKYFFGEGYTYGACQGCYGHGMEKLFPEGDVDPIPEWIWSLVIHPLESAKILEPGFVNSAVINFYRPGGCIVSHVDPIHLFDSGFAANEITHCVRPEDTKDYRAVIILRRFKAIGRKRPFVDFSTRRAKRLRTEDGNIY